MHVRFSLAFGDAAKLPQGMAQETCSETGQKLGSFSFSGLCVTRGLFFDYTWFSEFPNAMGNGISALMGIQRAVVPPGNQKNLVRLSRFVGQKLW